MNKQEKQNLEVLKKIADGLLDPVMDLIPSCRGKKDDCNEARVSDPCDACRAVKAYTDFNEALDRLDGR